MQRVDNKWQFQISVAVSLAALILILSFFDLNYDVGSLLISTDQLLNGGNYVSDFFIPNPPITLYLYVIPIFLTKITSLSITSAYYIYIFCLSFYICFICYKLLTLLEASHKEYQAANILPILALTLFLLPGMQIGQRDQLFVILSLPYLLLIACRLENQKIGLLRSIICGTFLALGTSMKPQFAFTPVLIEIYYLYRKRHIAASIRPETVAAAIILLCYIAAVFIFHRQYITVILPYTLDHYYSSIGQSFLHVLTQPAIVFCVCQPFIFLALPSQHRNTLLKILCIALVGTLLTYVSQRTTFPHHVLAPLSISILFSYLLLNTAYTNRFKPDLLLTIIPVELTLFAFMISSYFMYLRYIAINPPKLLVFSGLFSLIIGIIYACRNRNVVSLKKERILYVGILSLTFGIPYTYSAHVLTDNFIANNYFTKKVKKSIGNYSNNKRIMTIAASTFYSPLIIQNPKPYKQYYDCIWMLTDLFKSVENNNVTQEVIAKIKSKSPLNPVSRLASDIKNIKPEVILIDYVFAYANDKTNIPTYEYLKENSAFKGEWKNYHFVKEIKMDGSDKIKTLIFARDHTIKGNIYAI